ncbi:hypothetical protein HYDPIDRAFT_169340 [Hydnomerulius pinastri MD-312]|uniref:Fungal-type protein kinase domain-containing protein n=1 Tax=Hydnomerulius pinastri MD-312 TaxID=994086 RepID=A0A0C9V8C4_9AGAM|nr:hypothetical protein HYDPIDRAFT_169340 [Hydnomerulius pinastri MD-312]
MPASTNDPISIMRANNIIKVIFSSRGLVGCSTICYFIQWNNKDFIIKDYWVLGDDGSVKNEMGMLGRIKGIPGVPELINSWIVKIETGTPNKTSAYCLPSMQDFKHKLVQALQDILSIQEQAVMK